MKQTGQSLILVVDDDDSQRLLASVSLQQSGFSILEAANGAQAIEIFQQYQPDLVLLDVVMPGMDGFSTCTALRCLSGGRNVPIVMVTGLDDVQSIEQAYQAGATDFITKPIQWLILHHRVRYILRASRTFRDLQEGEERFRTLVNAAGSVILVLDRQGKVVEFNPVAERFFPLRRGELIAESFTNTLSVVGNWDALLEESQNFESTIQALEGDDRILLWSLSGFANAEGALAGLVIVGQDVTARRKAEENMRKLSYVVEQNPISILITDVRGNIEYVNPKFSEISGYHLEEIQGKNPYFLQTNTLSAEEYQRMHHLVASGDVWRGELCSRRKDGGFFWESAHISAIRNPQGVVTHFVWLREDISDRKNAEERIRFLAYYDNLTRLPNRVMLQERLREAIEISRIHGQLLAVMFLDLDQFKRINDSLGHRAGDLLLQQVADRLQEYLRFSDQVYITRTDTPLPQDLLARLGGDEFVIVLTEISHSDAVTQVAQRVLEAMAKPFVVDNREIFTGCSIGIALYPEDGADMDILLKHADTALYYAKDRGRNNYQMFSSSMNVATTQRLTLENHLRKALKNQELILYYQPQVALNSGIVTGVEALLRWNNPKLGMVSPEDFIPVAEETGLIVSIGEWVLRTACSQARTWQVTEGLSSLRMAVNLSPRQFADPDFVERIAVILRETGLQPELLELEITESLLMQGGLLESLLLLKEIGVMLSIDDFGTGYSNLSYLQRFPVDRLKIDKSFVKDIGSKSDQNNTIAGAVIAMARSLRLGVIAEGVETKKQADILRLLGCDEMQGYYFSRPYPPEQVIKIINDHRVPPSCTQEVLTKLPLKAG
ncbi:MAG TPA: EAL domain-containing protein [Candidatus Competibacteraceae bacterium]|nr:EAL domain-containing protein [Candidatus Competibacteraceae bacterium]MCP5132542.1 EAL domain-containing protein [Gammaproteobacteria bacterium]HPF59051.1 EAL domain-containing protein [Candidatus Competibacteraceae bacterium]